jgi:hypothetical protein
MVALIENSGFGGQHAAPAVRGIYDVYYRKTRHEEPPGTVAKQIAKNEPAKPEPAKPAPAKPAPAKPVAAKSAARQQTAANNR